MKINPRAAPIAAAKVDLARAVNAAYDTYDLTVEEMLQVLLELTQQQVRHLQEHDDDTEKEGD